MDVVIPAWNAQEFLPALLDSLLPDLPVIDKIVIVDNNSTDETYCRAVDWKSEHAHVNVLVVKEFQSGACAARNKGLKYCTSEWVRFLDADDLVTEKSSTALLNFAASKEVDFIYSHFISRKANGAEDVVESLPHPLLAIASFRSGTTGSNLFRRKSFDRLGEWNAGYSSAQENELMHRWARCGGTSALFPEVTYVHQSRNDGTQISSRSKSDQLRNRLKIAHASYKWIRKVDTDGKATSLIVGELFNTARKCYPYDQETALEKTSDLGIDNGLYANPIIPRHYSLAFRIGGLPMASRLTQIIRKLS